jgi:hypothetical protein
MTTCCAQLQTPTRLTDVALPQPARPASATPTRRHILRALAGPDDTPLWPHPRRARRTARDHTRPK